MRITRIRTLSFVVALIAFSEPSSLRAHIPHDVITDLDVFSCLVFGKTAVSLIFAIARDALLRSSDGGLRWKNLVNGLDNRNPFSSIAISPNFDTDHFVFVSSEGDGLYRSVNGGDSWCKVNTGLSNPDIALVTVSPHFASDGIVLAAGTAGGLFRSWDRGDRWTPIKRMDCPVTAITFLRGCEGQILVGDRRGYLYHSADAGASWTRLSRLEGGPITALASSADYRTDGTLFAGTARRTPWRAGKLYRSLDRGARFVPLDLPIIDRAITSIAVSPSFSTDRTVFVSTWSRGAFRSADGGNSWKTCSDGLSAVAESTLGRPRPDFTRIKLSTTFTSDQTAFLAGFDGLFKSTERGNQWDRIETISVRYIDGIDISNDHCAGVTIACNTYGAGIYVAAQRSPSEFDWKIANRGLNSIRGLDIAFSPCYGADQSLFATGRIGCSPFVRSVDGGHTWCSGAISKGAREALMERLASASILPRRASNALAAYSGFETTVLAVSPSYQRDRTIFVGGMRGQVFRSTDGGARFACARRAGGRGAVKSLAISPNFGQDGTLFASIGNFDLSRIATRVIGLTVRTRDRVLRTCDNGETWHDVGEQLPLEYGMGIRLAISPNYRVDRAVFAATAIGLFRSTDSGENWARVGSGSPFSPESYIEALGLSPEYANDQEVLISVRGSGLFKSMDGGETFRQVGQELIANNHSLAPMFGCPGFGQTIRFSPTYAEDDTILGTSSEELFLSADRGETWAIVKRPVRYEDGSHTGKVLAFDRPQDWQVRPGLDFSMGTATCSDVAGSQARFRFVGNSVRLVGSRGDDQGIAEVYLDGRLVGCIDQFGPSRRSMVTLYSAEGLNGGPHELVLRVTGRRHPDSRGCRIEVDAFDVLYE